jgi:AcrR family transcriptional regulator
MAGNDDETRRRIGFDARRQLIVEAALEVFAERGYHAASLGEIARRAGVTKPVLYDHFSSKRDLHLWLLEQQRDALFEHTREHLTGTGTAAERVERAVDAVFAYVETHPFAWRLLFRESTGEPEIIEAHRRIQQQASQAIVNTLMADAAVAVAGDDREGTAAALGELLGGGMRGVARWWYDHREMPRERLVRLVMDVYWLGLERLRARPQWPPGATA